MCNTIQDDTMFYVSCKFDESKVNPYWIIVLTSPYDTNYVLNNHEDFHQNNTRSIPSEP